MRTLGAAAFISISIAACGGQSTASPPNAQPTNSATTQAVTPTVAIIDVPKIAGKTQKEVASLLGEPISCEAVKQGKKCLFKSGTTEIVFISGKADWITIEDLEGIPYSDDALPPLGLDKAMATVSNDFTMRWDGIPGLLEVSIFPTEKGVDYAYIKTATP